MPAPLLLPQCPGRHTTPALLLLPQCLPAAAQSNVAQAVVAGGAGAAAGGAGREVVWGGQLLLLWMGPNYVNAALIATVAIGNFAMFTFMPAMSILTGLNAHGRPGIVHLVAAICSVGLVIVAIGPLHSFRQAHTRTRMCVWNFHVICV